MLLFNKVPQAGIRLHADAVPQAEYAAGQLRYYLGLMTGGAFDVGDMAGDTPCILLMPPEPELGSDGFRIASDGAGVRLYGGKRGIIYAAYELLERLGCRFFAVDCELVPVREYLAVPDMDLTQVPVLEYREHNYADLTQHARFAVKSRLNGQSHSIPESMGGHISYAWFVHTVDQMVPQDLYAQAHPEYYALWEGKRQTQRHTGQLCLTNPGTQAAAIRHVREALLNNPKATMISLSQNDWNGHNCQCPDCLASDEAEGSPAGTMLRFVNAVAEALEPEFPGVVFSTLAYNYTRPAPRLTRPRANVSVQLCSIECCFSHPFETCDDHSRHVKRPDGTTSSFISDLRAWGKVSSRNYIWDYTTSFAHYPSPHPNWRCLQPNMRAFISNGVKGVFEQANGAKGGGSDLNELRAYVLAKLLWDADTDVDRHIREFTDHYYGAAGSHIRRYIDILCDQAEQHNHHVGFNDNPDSDLFSDEVLDALMCELKKAKEAVAGDAVRMMRVDKAMLSPRYVRIRRDICLKGSVDIEAINAFIADWRAHRLTRMEEWFSRESTLRSFLDGKWRSRDYFKLWTDESPEIL
ncbi:MAG: DUF4838 domain-containing protein [Clostridiales bacterium]|nr:DUF4838 domain-containing protein [Clostridiales bacterium]